MCTFRRLWRQGTVIFYLELWSLDLNKSTYFRPVIHLSIISRCYRSIVNVNSSKEKQFIVLCRITQWLGKMWKSCIKHGICISSKFLLQTSFPLVIDCFWMSLRFLSIRSPAAIHSTFNWNYILFTSASMCSVHHKSTSCFVSSQYLFLGSRQFVA